MSAAHLTFLPRHYLLAAAVCAAAMVLLVLMLAMQQPWLGFRFIYDSEAGGARVSAVYRDSTLAPGTFITHIGGAGRELELQAVDFTVEPDGNLPTYRDYDTFLERQGQLYAIQSGAVVELRDASGTVHRIVPEASRALSTLPPEFWVSLVVGVFAWLLSAAVWSFRPHDPSARYLLVSGLATLMFAPLAAVYTTRELALPATLFRWLSDLNFFGGNLYAAALPALLWYYPRPLGRRALGPWLLAAFLLWFVLQQSGLIESMIVGRRLSVLIALLLTAVFAVLQWRGTRRDPIARAALRWFLLAWIVGVALFSVLIFVPQIYGVDTGPLQGYSFLIFLLIYAGLALGILRYGLFGLGQWWSPILNWVVGVLLLVSLDLLFSLGLQLSSGISLSLALLICGFVWLPVRNRLWQYFTGARSGDTRDSFRKIVTISLSPVMETRAALWHELLRDRFDPLRVQPRDDVGQPAITDQGLCLLVPPAAGSAGLCLEHAQSGQRLFGARDLQEVRELLDILDYVDASRDAYERGVSAERLRIARDLHDDVSIHLLSGLRQDDIAAAQQKMREAMAEIRTLVSGLEGEQLSLADICGQLRHETQQRLDAVDLQLDWSPSGADLDGFRLPYAQYKNFMSAQREIVSNVIRHAGATRVQVLVAMQENFLELTVSDDGVGLGSSAGAADTKAGSYGLANMRRRLESIGGDVRFNPCARGTSITLRLPL